MQEYYVKFVTKTAAEESLIVLSSFWKLLFWFLRMARKCIYIRISVF